MCFQKWTQMNVSKICMVCGSETETHFDWCVNYIKPSINECRKEVGMKKKTPSQIINGCGMSREHLAWKSGLCTRTIQRATVENKWTNKVRDAILFAINTKNRPA
jgi:hypothetical protein